MSRSFAMFEAPLNVLDPSRQTATLLACEARRQSERRVKFDIEGDAAICVLS